MTSAVSPGSRDGGDARDRVVLVKGRLASVDLLRGIVMVLMVLDHTRDFLGDPRLDPTNLARSTTALFFTRWVTHFCAPIFVFLAGAAAYLARALGKVPTARGLAGYLATRGLFLVVMELTVVHWGWNFNLKYQVVVLQVIWAIGLSMLLLAALVAAGLPSPAVGAIGAVVILAHNLVDLAGPGGTPGGPDGGNWLWNVLLRPGAIPLGGAHMLVLAYPVLPWFGVMAAGFAFGEVLLGGRRGRIRLTAAVGLTLLVAFVSLRAVNVYGDPNPWKVQDTVIKTILSFLNCQKYPPSLLYLLMTMGPGLLALAAFEASEDYLVGPTGPARRAFETLGRVPLFFYLLQWPVIHILTNLAATASGQTIDWFAWSFDYPAGYGFRLPVVYAMWAAVAVILYFPSRWYAGLKSRHRDVAWLSYL
jgi:uncharacterized membrane protein